MCHHLQYVDALVVSTANYGQGNGQLFVTNVDCNGEEKSILECGHDLYTSHCSHSEDAGVRCTGMLFIKLPT